MDFKGQERCNDTHASTTGTDARLFKKSQGDKSRLCHMGHILMENRTGLIVDVEVTHANGTAEREAALAMLGRRGNRNKLAAVGTDILDEVQHAMGSEDGDNMLLALKAARNEINPRPEVPGYFLFIGTGSHRLMRRYGHQRAALVDAAAREKKSRLQTKI